jgi:uncharacterized protein YqhQ
MARFFYGGQAVMEGVMMRGRREIACAVRKMDGSIVVRREPLPKHYSSALVKLPFVRGLQLLWDMLVIGTRMLIFSTETAASTEDEPIKFSGAATGVTLMVSLTFSIGLFFVLPVFAAGWIRGSILSNLVEGVIRLALLVGYLWLIGNVPDIKRVFAYHGAEHKTVHAHEAGVPLDVAHARPFSLAHVRCGTGFLLVVVVICVFVFALLGRPPFPLRILSRVVLVPLVAALAYVLIRLAANHYDNPIVHALMAPSMALQGLTTREPDDDQLEVAIVALRAVLASEEANETAPEGGVQTVIPARAVTVAAPA